MIKKYSTRRRLSFNISDPKPRSKSEKINIDPLRILELDTETNSFIVRSIFNRDVIYTLSLQGERVYFKPLFYNTIDLFEKKKMINKIE